ncbi:M1-specific T cell receptor alpha chain [Osmerus mordax]|uniref:M1-specific T cell receptor alpha chain n=1 Tax=Osmerus mordax TaxID=8014 RepID=UPI00350F4BC8
MIFGHGTKVVVDNGESMEPSYYDLKKDETKACLATDFSPFNSSIFNDRIEATRMEGDTYYSQVALGQNCPSNNTYEACTAQGIESDVKTRFLSLTILGLRILLVKTIIFNVLMTLRVWIS